MPAVGKVQACLTSSCALESKSCKQRTSLVPLGAGGIPACTSMALCRNCSQEGVCRSPEPCPSHPLQLWTPLVCTPAPGCAAGRQDAKTCSGKALDRWQRTRLLTQGHRTRYLLQRLHRALQRPDFMEVSWDSWVLWLPADTDCAVRPASQHFSISQAGSVTASCKASNSSIFATEIDSAVRPAAQHAASQTVKVNASCEVTHISLWPGLLRLCCPACMAAMHSVTHAGSMRAS